MEETLPQNKDIVSVAVPDSNRVAVAWGLFWRYIFSWSSVLFFFAAIVCFFAYNWADMSVFTKFSLIAGLMALAAFLPIFRGVEGFTGSAGLLFCGLLAGPLLAVYGQYYQTGANEWELFRTWAVFLLPLALVGRRTGPWFAFWVVASLAFFLFLLQQNTLYPSWSQREGIWVSLPFVFSQIFFLALWEGAAFFRRKGSLSFLETRWLPRLVAALILFYLTAVMWNLLINWHLADDMGVSPFLPRYGLVYFLFLVCCGFYYTKKVPDLVMIGLGLTGIIATGFAVLLKFAVIRWSDTTYLLVLAVYILLASVAAVKILLFCHKMEKRRRGGGKREEEAHSAFRGEEAERASFFTMQGLGKLAFAFGFGGNKPVPNKTGDEKPEETAHWIIPFLMGFAAWVTVPLLLAGLFFLVEDFADKNDMIVLFLAIMGTGAALSRGKGIFASQTGLCLGLCGTIGAAIFIPLEYKRSLSESVLVPAILLFSLGFFLIPNRVYRLIATSSAFSLFFIQVLLKMKELTVVRYGRLFWTETRENISLLQWNFFLILLILAFGASLIALVHFWMKAEHGEKQDFLQKPVLSGAFLAMIALSSVLYLDAYALKELFRHILFIATQALSIAAGLGLIWFSIRISKELSLTPAIMAGLVVISILLGVAGIKIYWIPVAFFLICLARYAASIPLMGLAITFLSTMTVLEYYNQTTSLLQKSYSLAILGFLLGVFGLALHFVLKAFFMKKSELVMEEPGTVQKENKGLGMDRLGRGAVFCCVCVFLLLFAGSVREKEVLLASGTEIVLALRPLDPRSLMQGDYMILRFGVEDRIRDALQGQKPSDPFQREGVAIVKADENGVADFLRFDDGIPLAQGEMRLVYRRKSKGIQVGSGAFFFQEGHASDYDAAQFAVLKVDKGGESLITDLLDEKMKVIRGGK